MLGTKDGVVEKMEQDTKEKIKSLANQLIIFDGNRNHCSVAQTDTNLRINVNINIL